MENSTVFDAAAGIIRATGKMTIKNLVEVMAMYKPGKHFTSDTFNVGDTPMQIRVYPNGETDGYRGYISIYLRNRGDADITVKATFYTDACSGDNDQEEFVIK